MSIITSILQVLLGLFFSVSGARKIAGSRREKVNYEKWRYPAWLLAVTGGVEITGAVGMLVSIFRPELASLSGILLCILLVGSLYTRIFRAKDKVWIFSIGLFLMSAAVAILRIMAFLIGILLFVTKPDLAPFESVPAQQIISFDNDSPELFEAIAFDEKDNMYVTLASKGEIRKITPEGTQSTFAVLPSGKFNLYKLEGILATLVINSIGDMFVTVVAENPDNKGIWRISPEGKSQLWVKLPPEALPNGITIDRAGNLFVADSGLMLIWRIPRDARAAERWITHDLLGKTGNKFLPGPNGVKFWRGDLYVSVSNARHVVRIPVQPDGSAGEPSVYIGGIPADDFAFDAAGNIYLTTHFNNTVIRVSREGKRAVIGAAKEHIIGPTAVAFGRTNKNRDKLFVINDGGFGNPLSAGVPNIMRLDVGVPGLPIP